MTLACISLCFLVLAGAIFHLAWRLALLALLWAPSAAVGIVTGWYVALGSGHVAAGVATAIAFAALVRFAILGLWRYLVAPRDTLFVSWVDR